MDVLDEAGVLTTGATDNKAAGVEASLVMLSTQSLIEGVTVFGYFAIRGTAIVNKVGDGFVDPDYNNFTNCNLSGGFAIIGADTTPASEGFTGTKALGTGFFGCDHHTRADGDYTIPCVYIDGNLATIGDIRAHSFVGCNFRTLANTAIKLDHCDDISIVGGNTEFSQAAGVSGADLPGKIVGTSNTGNVRMFGLGGTNDLGIVDLIQTISGRYQIIGSGGTDVVYLGQGGKTVMIYGDTASGDSVVQLTKDASSVNTGWSIRRDDDQSDALDIRYNNVSELNLKTDGTLSVKKMVYLPGGTLVVGVDPNPPNTITITASSHNIDATGSPTITTINGGVSGMILRLKKTGTGTVTIGEGGNVVVPGTTIALNAVSDEVWLAMSGTTWSVVSFSDNA